MIFLLYLSIPIGIDPVETNDDVFQSSVCTPSILIPNCVEFLFSTGQDFWTRIYQVKSIRHRNRVTEVL
jgi:hypothetical protein